jgi:uncharacterized protein YutE (UPF0331/DUF86 family)
MKKKDKDFIEDNLRHLRTTMDILSEGIQKPEWDKYQLAGMGAYLANIYNGYENILRTLLESEGIKIHKGEQWHKDLLDTAKSKGFVPDEMLTTLKGMLGFRHLQAHGYSYVFEEEKIRYFSLEAVKSHPAFESHTLKIIEKVLTKEGVEDYQKADLPKNP